ncbi:MAG: cbb3-type cytochrome c oxidase subunit 3 [Phenylobacterium sp.]|uniref:cbb3-type cytochrome c oxidase subunit 3 n=1 Tax=Phenylobacterium sp. TaxID=1871053 RepID=UPI0025F3BED3|nr:cbb3-type cytochrome c oxidase subunit 3 [Phenylobacterium sp.]MCG9915108.1 cbb3-type cytochrome c oxidase subunit 3 [Phenylobacterium sp.]
MSALSYETVARFAQQGGTLYFAAIFAVAVAYALWPRNGEVFRRAAMLPLEKDEDDNVQA